MGYYLKRHLNFFDLKTTLFTGTVAAYFIWENKFGEVCLAVFAVGWQKIINNQVLRKTKIAVEISSRKGRI